MRVSEIRVKRIRANQGLGVFLEGHKPLQNLSQNFVAFSEYMNFINKIEINDKTNLLCHFRKNQPRCIIII